MVERRGGGESHHEGEPDRPQRQERRQNGDRVCDELKGLAVDSVVDREDAPAEAEIAALMTRAQIQWKCSREMPPQLDFRGLLTAKDSNILAVKPDLKVRQGD